ncbi:superoxide dismutase [Cu-Zn] 5-like [Dermacentor albipictus]|uniref:superoxide dismutase [Cu-Zn] 5-like n=1 Tax=Dermacentor albipictus TaxID=60249 RepID=UPI0031FDE300
MGTSVNQRQLLVAVVRLSLLMHAVSGDATLRKASCRIVGKNVEGLLVFMSHGDIVAIRGIIDGLEPGKHGLTVNESGNVTDNCDAVGAHFNPYGKEHGPETSENSHLGDLGNVDATEDLIAVVQKSSRRIRLHGNDSIVSRSCVVYERPDDYGAKGDVLSKSTGNMGDPVGCGLIRGFGKHAASSAPAFALPLRVSPLAAAFVLSAFLFLDSRLSLSLFLFSTAS